MTHNDKQHCTNFLQMYYKSQAELSHLVDNYSDPLLSIFVEVPLAAITASSLHG